jgi:glycerol uptake facilitator-like aquaporin
MDLTKFVAEFIGTFVFIGVILASGEPIPIAIALAAVIFFMNNVSGGHVNPAVSLVKYAQGHLTIGQTTTYIVAQVLGGLCALYWIKKTHKK